MHPVPKADENAARANLPSGPASDGFDEAHARDVAAGLGVVRTLAFVALNGDQAGIAAADRAFAAAYDQGQERAA